MPQELIHKKENKIETSAEVIYELNEKIKEYADEASVIEEHPTENRLLIQKNPIIKKVVKE